MKKSQNSPYIHSFIHSLSLVWINKCLYVMNMNMDEIFKCVCIGIMHAFLYCEANRTLKERQAHVYPFELNLIKTTETLESVIDIRVLFVWIKSYSSRFCIGETQHHQSLDTEWICVTIWYDFMLISQVVCSLFLYLFKNLCDIENIDVIVWTRVKWTCVPMCRTTSRVIEWQQNRFNAANVS